MVLFESNVKFFPGKQIDYFSANQNLFAMNEMPHDIEQYLPLLIGVIIVLAVWEIIWKLIALWKAARNNHLAWFVLIGIINSAGILPIIYLLLNREKKL